MIEVGGGDAAGLARYLAGLAVPVTVLGPPEVAAAVRAHAAALLAANPA
jgi:hypothetical protein